MPDIFISYKKEEGATASTLATRLTEAGYDVWWDDALLAGERYEDEIAAVLDRSRAVVVLWSRQSVKSEWVKAEAEAARQARKVFPIIIDDMPPAQMPLLFRGVHAAIFEGWTGELDHPGYVELIGSLRDRLGRPKGPELTEKQAEAKLAEAATEAVRTISGNTGGKPEPAARAPSPAPKRKLSLVQLLVGLFVLLIALGGGGTLLYTQMNAISPEDAGRIERCTTWAASARLDWYTALPSLDATTVEDCERASARFPDNGDYLGMLAMVRIAQSDEDAEQAVALANRAIDRGGAWGHYAMGVMYHQGINFAVDYARSATAFRTAADMGLVRAQGRLCLMGVDGSMTLAIPATREEIGGYCSRGAEAGDSLALLAIGYAYETGVDGRIVNMPAAADYYQRAYALGDGDAAVRLGILHHRGVGVAYDLNRAVELYQEAADHGNPSGIRSLAISYELGEGLQQDVNLASQMYEEAAFRRDVPALLLTGYGIGPPAVLTARQIYDANLLATPDTITGHRIRGLMLAYGNLRNRDVVAAEAELTTCADLGNALCEAMLGYFYQAGLNGQRDAARALPLYESGAAKGNMYAQFHLGTMYEYGEAVAMDVNRAIEYFRLAAQQGHLSAQHRLSYYNQPLPN
jgi:TPR repeat protein